MCLVVPHNLPSDIPKFEGKNGEDPEEHVTTFHLWHFSNSLNHDSVRLQLFQLTLMGPTAKLYIEFPRGTYQTFNDLALTFINQFQLSVHYDAGT